MAIHFLRSPRGEEVRPKGQGSLSLLAADSWPSPARPRPAGVTTENPVPGGQRFWGLSFSFGPISLQIWEILEIRKSKVSKRKEQLYVFPPLVIIINISVYLRLYFSIAYVILTSILVESRSIISFKKLEY